jgi:hypothetical protein
MSKRAVRRALLVGVNHYPDPRNNLKGCVNDVLMMAQMLTTNYQFESSDIRLLTDERATTSGIRQRLRWLVEDTAPGSVLLFRFSGHGSQVRDRDGDELDDGLDEILCPYDLDWDDPFSDDEIAQVIEAVPQGVNFTIVLDCCHSGTGTRQFFKEPAANRAPNPRYLVPPPDVAFRAADRIELDPRWHFYQVEHDYVVPVPEGAGGAHSSFFAESNDLVQRDIVTTAVTGALD